MNYIPLWVKSDYTLLSSLIKIDDLIEKAKSLDMTSLALCDDDLFYAAEFYQKCKKNEIKPIFGLEINIEGPILLYAKNYKGYQNLCVIDTLKNSNKLSEEVLLKHLDNLLVVLPYESKDKKEKFDALTEVFIGYQNDIEKDDISGPKVFALKTLTLDKSDEEYLTYLYKIKDEDVSLTDVSLLSKVSTEDKKSTICFGDLCLVDIPKQNNLLPLYNDDKNFDAKAYLKDLCIFGLKKRFPEGILQKYVKRLKYELDVIDKMGFNNYFLVVFDYVKYAKKNGILVGPGRGSAASSLVSFVLGITDVDPLKYDLLFERFLNPQRITMPDIDIDFDADKRYQVINYVKEKYGVNKVSGIITFSNLAPKQVVRDVSRIFEIATYKVDELLSYFDDTKDLERQKENPNIKKILLNDDLMNKMYDVSMHLEGLKRHASVHAAGIVISCEDLCNYVPLALDSDGTYLCGYTMNYIEDLGLLKMDFLGLKNLTIIDKVMKHVSDVKFNEIPLDDKKTFKIFEDGNLDGVFQFESPGMKKFILDLKPSSINDLIAAVALFRPGPMENIKSYILRKEGKEKITYLDDALKPILKDTYGIIVYQEQIMQIASAMAGFSYGEADVLRRAMSKKKVDMLSGMKAKFITGSLKNGHDEEVATKVYDLILKFANYGFNKAHSVSYAIIGYKLAYLKAHYPLYFMCEILNANVGVSAKTKAIINECKALGVTIIKPSVNTSSYEYKVNGNSLEYSLAMIKNVGTLTCRELVKEREENGPFTSYLDFVKRQRKLGKDVLRAFVLSGALDVFKLNKRTMMENLDDAINYADLCGDLDESLVIKPEIKVYEEYDADKLTSFEEELYGFYISNHPVSKYVKESDVTINKLDNYFDKNVTMTLYFEKKKDINTKNGDKMMFITASDPYGSIDVVMFPRVYDNYFNIKVPGVYEVYVHVEKRFSKLQLVINTLKKKED